MDNVGLSQKGARVGVTVLGSGSKGNCTIVHYGRQAIMIDAGFSCRETQRRFRQCQCLRELSLDGILVTHEHKDHVSGLRVCSEYFEAPVYAASPCARAIREKEHGLGQVACFVPGGEFGVGPFRVIPFSVPHNASSPVGFIIAVNDWRIGYATDVGYVSSNVEYNLKACDALVVESNHDMNMLAASDRPWTLKQRIMSRDGHLSNDSTAQLLENVITQNTRNVILAHLSQDCNTREKAMECACQALGVVHRRDISLLVAQQEAPIDTVWIG